MIISNKHEKINILYPEFVLSVGDPINGYTRDAAQIRFEWDEVNDIINHLHDKYGCSTSRQK